MGCLSVLSAVKPTQVAIMLAAVFLLLIGIFVDDFPRIFDILLGCYLGIMWGSMWNDSNRKWREKHKDIILHDSSYVIADEKLHRIKNIYYIWLMHRLWWFVAGAISLTIWGSAAYWAMQNLPKYTWYVNLLIGLIVGIVAFAAALLPVLLLVYVKKKEPFKFIGKHKRLFRMFDAED